MTFPTLSQLFPLGDLDPALAKTYFQNWLQATLDRFGDGSSAEVVRANQGISSPVIRNIVRNGSFKMNTRVTMPSTDNGFGVDGWRLLLEAANAAALTRDSTNTPPGAQYAMVLTVGAGNNNKFGLCQLIPSFDSIEHRGMAISVVVPLMATAGLTNGTGKIRIGIAEFTGTADAVSGDPISSWGAEGTNPTLAASWAWRNTPAAIAVGTTWAEYVVENVSIGATANNLALVIWCDEKSTTQTTDILRIGGAITMARGSKAPMSQAAAKADEEARCLPHAEKSYDDAQAPAAVATAGAVTRVAPSTAVLDGHVVYKTRKFNASAPTVYSPATGASGQIRDVSAGSDSSLTVNGTYVGQTGFYWNKTAAPVSSNGYAFQWFYTDGIFG